jgi:hypothetical protein
MDTKFQDLIREIEIDTCKNVCHIRYVAIQNKLWFVVADICKAVGANLANIYNRMDLPVEKIKLKKQHVKLTDIHGAEQILSTSRSEKVECILDSLVKITKNYNQQLKVKLIEKKFVFNKCYKCGLNGIWQDKPLDLILADTSDLFLLCPNCYWQTERVIFIETCQQCDRNVPVGHKFCLKCKKNVYPDKEKLRKDLIKYGISGVEKKYAIDEETIIFLMNRT